MPKSCLVELHHDRTLVQHATYPDAGYRSLLPKLTEALPDARTNGQIPQLVKSADASRINAVPEPKGSRDEMVTQDEFWPLWSTFFKEGDMIIGETGTSSFDC